MRTPKKNPHTALEVNPICHSVENAARALSIGRSMAYRLIREGQLTAVRIGGRTLVPVQACEDFVNRLKQDENSPALELALDEQARIDSQQTQTGPEAGFCSMRRIQLDKSSWTSNANCPQKVG